MSVGSGDLVATVQRLFADGRVRRLRIVATSERTHLTLDVERDEAEEPTWLPMLRVVAELTEVARLIVEREDRAPGGDATG
ncbi:hypothetical protein [Rubellimicrobium roseum]|uniref:Uncharacterized protein n=1 Tax=Rubellimicrobium roseum TaxID=687525 RepID=A0A5C4NCZ6_9RHOB|nr:hypothetical protein [Rubellimicrobium roseum]TNC70879.1 hypothetical protein FHG71_12820 [Rubellimicrobium roseum]